MENTAKRSLHAYLLKFGISMGLSRRATTSKDNYGVSRLNILKGIQGTMRTMLVTRILVKYMY